MDKKTFLDDNTTPDIDIEEEKKSDVKFKFLLIILVMVIIVISKLSKNEISISNFSNFTYSFSFHRLYECRNYFLFLMIMLPLCYFLSKSNNEWVKGEIDTFVLSVYSNTLYMMFTCGIIHLGRQLAKRSIHPTGLGNCRSATYQHKR